MRLLKEAATASRYCRRLLIGTAVACLPGVPAWAQGRQGGPLVGFLAGAESADRVVKMLGELGYSQGRNLGVVAIAAGSMRGLPDAASRLVARHPDVLVGEGAAVMALAAFSQSIPIVCQGGVPDPVSAGLAKSLERPGGNVTGLASDGPDTAATVFGLVKQMRPGLGRVAMLHTEGSAVQGQMRAYAEQAKAAGLEWIPTVVGSIDDAERVLPPLAGQAAWMAALGAPRLWRPVMEIAHKHRIATIGNYPGALVAYARAFTDAPRRVAAIIDRILKGAKPADIAFELPDRATLTLNRAAARTIGIEIPQAVLLRATEVVD